MNVKYPLAILAFAAALSGCSSDDNENHYVKGDTDVRISFSNPFIDNAIGQQRTATPTTTDNLEGFKVWGFVKDPGSVVFDGAEVSRNGAGWSVSETEYWYLGQPYWFTAISTGDEDAGYYSYTPGTEISTDNYAGNGIIRFDNKAARGDEDLVYAFSGRVQYDTQESVRPVSLTFNHLLSQVTFQFSNDMTQRTTLEIENLKLTGGVSSATIDMTQGLNQAKWTPGDETFDITDISTEDFGYMESTVSEPSYIIPTAPGLNYSISFTVIVKNGNNEMARYDHTIALPQTEFMMGKSYKFKANLNANNINPAQQLQSIEFTVDNVSEWQPDEEIVLPASQM